MKGKKINQHKHSVYVVELDRRAIGHKSLRDQRGNLGPDGRCLYVGMTGLDPKKRFENHRNGHKSCTLVRKYGLYLRPKLYRRFNPMSYEDAVVSEKQLAQRLRRKGHAVHQA